MTLRRVAMPAICLLVFSLCTTAAHANSWIYTFSGTNSAIGGDGLAVAFKYSAHGPITGFTPLLSSQLLSCTNCLVSAGVPAVFFQPNDVFGDSIVFNDVRNTANVFMFRFGAFVKPGTYVGLKGFNPGTLTVQAVPEPSSVILFLSGLGGIAGIARRKLQPR